MSRLLGGQEKDLLLLTATPITNGLWDLYHMVMAFARHDQAFGPHGISSLRHLFLNAGANERDPENLDPDVLFPLADMVSVRRDRRFIESRYPGATFPDGTPVSFPTPHLTTERYRERVTVIGADTTTDQRTALLSRFCPETVVRPGYKPDDGEVDLLLSNDVLSEGQNLQQAGAVVSYDMPWNPQRMVQRYGRVIRLKSPHDEVHLTTMLPEAGDLEEILKLEIAIRRKIVAARPYGMEVEVVDNMEQEARAYARRVVDGDETLLDEDDEPGGTHGFSGEALRADLRRELEEGRGDELRELPWGIGAAFRQGSEVPSSGPPGVFFACRAKGERYWRYVDADGVVREPATILRRIDPGYAPGVDDPPIDLEVAWAKAVESIVEEHNEEALAPKSESLGPKQRWALELLADPTIAVPVGGGDAYEALRVGRSQPVRRALGEVKRLLDGEEITRAGAAKRIVDIVKMFGLRKVETVPEKEEITAEDVGVVCWMGVVG